MKTWKRVTLVTLVLVGGTLSFASWSLEEFDNALAVLQQTRPVATVITSRPPGLRMGTTTVATTTVGMRAASSSPSTTARGSISAQGVIFPVAGGKVYAGCAYALLVQSSSTVSSLEIALMSAGTRAVVPSATSGLPKVHKLTTAQQQVSWKVGSVWPGVYYLSLDKINETSLMKRSYTFTIYESPAGLDDNARRSLCESTGGTL